jgi:glycosyltransferase involved in cell wall biosynthesis
MSREKDYRTIVRAFAALKGRDLDCRLVIAGEGPGRRGVEELACRLGTNGQVTFLGRVSDSGPVLAAADVFVHASKSEGSSNAVLEAMAHSVPSVVSRIAPNEELLGGCAWSYFEPGDWRECARGLGASAFERDAAASAGRAAGRRFAAMFDPADAIARRMEIYQGLERKTR